MSSAVVFILLELFLIKILCFFMGVANQVHILDFLSIIGYNFVGIIFTSLLTCTIGLTGKYIGFIYCSFSMFFFVVF